MSNPIRLIVCALFVNLLTIGIAGRLYAQQERVKLEKEKSKLENEISYTSKLIEETSKNKKATLSQLKLIKKNIKGRELLINTMSKQIASIDGNLSIIGAKIRSNEKMIKELKKEYHQMILAYEKQQRSNNMLMFVFASESFNQAYSRIKYFRQFQNYRKLQINRILDLQGQLIEHKKLFVSEKEAKRMVKSKEETVKLKLLQEKQKSDKSLQNLSKKEKELRKTLEDKKLAAAKLTKAIQKAIEEETRKDIANASSAKKTNTGTKYATLPMTAEETKLSNSFNDNKGRLPWPLTQGVVSENYGDHPHPVLKNVTVRNNGINISTNRNQPIKCVFEGVVTAIMYIEGFQNTVIIRHGEFRTVYSNIGKLQVKKDERVKTGQVIGYVSEDSDGGSGELHFELWKGKDMQNPSGWLMSK